MEPTVILLAGGKSTRFWPLSDKNLLSFFGKPLIVHQLEKIKKAGFENIYVVVNKENEFSLSSYHQQCILQKEHGFGIAVLRALEKVNGPVIFFNADDIFPIELLIKTKEYIEKKKPQALLTAVKVKEYFPGGYLVLKDNLVWKIIEKPGDDKMPSNYFKFVLDYFQSPEDLKNNLKKIKNSEDYEKALNETIKNGLRVNLLEYEGNWTSLKYPWHVLDSTEIFLKEITTQRISKNAVIDKTAIIKGPVIIEDGVKIFENAKIVGPAYIGKNVIIGNNTIIRKSIIEKGCIVGFSTDIARSYVGKNCWFHSNYIGDSVLDGNISLGAGANLANLRLDEGEISSVIKGKKINTGRAKLGSMIGRDVRIGINASIMPGVKIGKGTFIGSGVLLNQDIDENNFVTTETKLIIKDNLKTLLKSREEFRKKI